MPQVTGPEVSQSSVAVERTSPDSTTPRAAKTLNVKTANTAAAIRAVTKPMPEAKGGTPPRKGATAFGMTFPKPAVVLPLALPPSAEEIREADGISNAAGAGLTVGPVISVEPGLGFADPPPGVIEAPGRS